MAITAYVGLPGSGKSYGVVENVIMPSLKQGRTVFTNIPLNDTSEIGGQVIAFTMQDLENDPDWFQDQFHAGAICVIDEVWRLWPSGMKANRLEQGHKSFLAEHRHMVGEGGKSTDIVLVTQDLSQIAAYPRSLIETTYRTVKLTAVGQEKRYRIDVYQGGVTGAQPPERLKLTSQFGKYKPEIFALYQSQTMNQSAEHGDESRVDARANLLNAASIKYGIPAAIVLFIFMCWGVVQVYNNAYGPSEEDSVSRETNNEEIMSPVNAVQLRSKTANDQLFTDFDVHITFNLGNMPNINYRLMFENGSDYFTLSASQLRRLGFGITAIGSCLLKIEYSGESRLVTCRAYTENRPEPIIDLS